MACKTSYVCYNKEENLNQTFRTPSSLSRETEIASICIILRIMLVFYSKARSRHYQIIMSHFLVDIQLIHARLP